MDTSGLLLFPFLCAGIIIPIVISVAVRAILSRIKKLSDDEKSFLTFITFAVTLSIAYLVISNMFKDLFVM